MSSNAAASLLRIGALIVLVGVVLMGGRHLATLDEPTPTPDLAAVPTTTVPPVVDLSTSEPTQPPTPTPTALPPTPVPTVPPTPEPEQGRGSFPVPENTTGSSIIVERGPRDKKYVALTFDAGEGPGYTAEILDFLKERGLHASFGATGEWARANPDLVNRILDEGHLLFNHSESHRSWTGETTDTEPLTDTERTDQVRGAEEAVLDVADWNMQPFWRPPYGAWDPEGQVLLKSLGYDYTLYWTCDSLGWYGYMADEIIEWCSPDDPARGGPGAIILFHVTQEQDYLSLPGLVDAYQAEGYEIVTMDKMIEP